MLCAGAARADHEIKAALDRGTYVETAVVTGSSVTGTAFLTANAKRMDGILFNNTSTAVYIGTTTTTIEVGHSNIALGVPVLSSATFSLDGLMSSALAFTCTTGVATCEVRTLIGLNR